MFTVGKQDDDPVGGKPWTLKCAIDGLSPIKVDGKLATAAEVEALGGADFALEVGEHLVEFKTVAAGSAVDLILNRALTHQCSGVVELHLDENACCIGDACLMWPAPAAGGWGVVGASGGDLGSEPASLTATASDALAANLSSMMPAGHSSAEEMVRVPALQPQCAPPPRGSSLSL